MKICYNYNYSENHDDDNTFNEGGDYDDNDDDTGNEDGDYFKSMQLFLGVSYVYFSKINGAVMIYYFIAKMVNVIYITVISNFRHNVGQCHLFIVFSLGPVASFHSVLSFFSNY